MKTVGSHPGAGVFRSTLVVIFILVCIVSFLFYTSSLTHRVEEVAKKQVVINLKQALSMMLHDYAVKGSLQDLKKFDLENPFIPLAIYLSLPDNYHGSIQSVGEIRDYGWHFDLLKRRAIYRYSDQSIPDQVYVMKWVFEDINENGEQGRDEVGYLKLFGPELN